MSIMRQINTDIFLSESLRILAKRLSQSEPQLPLRQICCYSHYANIIFLKFSQNPSNLQQPNRLPHICHPFQPDIRPWFQFTDIDHRKNASCKSHLDCLMDSLLCHRDGAHLSGKSDLAKYDRFLIQRTVFIAGNQRHHDRKVKRRLVHLHAACNVDIRIVPGQGITASFFQHCHEQVHTTKSLPRS